MSNKKIMLWEKAPYVEYTSNGFEGSITEYKVNDNKTAVIVCPGGGYFGKADHEKGPIAQMLNDGGINAYTLDYNVHPCHKYAPLSDAQRAIRVLRSMGYEKVGILGFSAGGHLTCSAGTMYDFEAYTPCDEIDKLSARPDAFIPCYPVVSFVESYSHFGSRDGLFGEERSDYALARRFSCEKNVTKDTPPCFIWHTANDDVVPVKNSLELASALSANGVYFEMHIYPNGWHGLGLASDRNDISTWSKSLIIFLKNLNF